MYPECPVWRVWYDGRLVVDTSMVGLLPKGEAPLACAMTFLRGTRKTVRTGIGPGRELTACFAGRDGRELEVRFRLTERSAFCAVRSDGSGAQDLSVTRYPEGSVLLGNTGTLNAEGKRPQVRFAPSGKVIASWRHGLEQHLVFFDRPGDLAERRFAAMERVEGLVVEDGRQGCGQLFLTVPFTKAALPAPVFGAAVTPAFRAAFEVALARGGEDFWVPRGEPGEFAVAARRQGGVWQVAGVTAEARTLTVRFEDLWLRLPPELRAQRYTVEILRDPIKGETGDRVEEIFSDQAPDVRVALDLAKSGGFLLAFRPQPVV